VSSKQQKKEKKSLHGFAESFFFCSNQAEPRSFTEISKRYFDQFSLVTINLEEEEKYRKWGEGVAKKETKKKKKEVKGLA